jgi:hypothetical protein
MWASRTVLFLPLLSLPVQAQVTLLDAGVVCPRPVRGELIPAPGMEAGVIRIHEEEVGFDTATRRVPLIDLLSFGFRAALDPGQPLQQVTVVITHPPMGDRAMTRQEWQTVIGPGQTKMSLFTFEVPHEKVPGPWTFAIEREGDPLLEVPFDVVVADPGGAVESACFQFMS